MKIEKTFPPNIEDIRKHLEPFPDAVFTYGDTLYCPTLGKNEFIDEFLMEHETVHSGQQAGNPKEWWEMYLENREFRLNMEVEAYRYQFKAYKRVVKNRDRRTGFALKLAADLASPMYKLNITAVEAYKLIIKK